MSNYVYAKPDVSIIVTVHNAEKYLEECVMSAVNQTYKNIEIICVDGGSSDSSPVILEKLSTIDDRIIILNDRNTSYGHKVNIGIEKAKGDYICILESDDCLVKDMVENLYRIAQKQQFDVISGDYKVSFEYRNKKIGYILRKYPVESYDKVLDYNIERRTFIHGGITGTLFRKAFLLEENIKLNETPGASFQDQGFSYLVDLLSKTQYHLMIPTYIYTCDNPNSSVVDDKKILEITWECDYIKKQMIDRGIKDTYIWSDFFNYKYSTYINKIKYFNDAGKKIFKKRFKKELLEDETSEEYHIAEIHPSTKRELQTFKSNVDCFDDFKPKEYVAKRMKNVLEILDEFDAVLVGVGRNGDQLIQIANDYGKPFKSICDNSLNLQGKKKYGQIIQSVETAILNNKDGKYIISVENAFEEIKNQLIKFGVGESNIYLF